MGGGKDPGPGWSFSRSQDYVSFVSVSQPLSPVFSPEWVLSS